MSQLKDEMDKFGTADVIPRHTRIMPHQSSRLAVITEPNEVEHIYSSFINSIAQQMEEDGVQSEIGISNVGIMDDRLQTELETIGVRPLMSFLQLRFIGGNAQQRDVTLPVTKETFQNIPEVSFADIKKYISTEISEKCSICMDKFNQTDLIKILPCKHYFHKNCVAEWLTKYNHICPLCRQSSGEHTYI